MDRVKMSSKGQVVIPKRIRQTLNLNEGMEFLVNLDNGRIILEPLRSFTEALRGWGKEIWQGIDPKDYVNNERDAWEKQ